MQQLIIVLLALMIWVSPGVSGAAPEKITDPQHPLARELTTIYKNYLAVARQGNLTAILPYMTDDLVKRAPEVTTEMLRVMAATELDPRQAQFVQVDATPQTARLVYQQLALEAKVYQAIIFKRERAAWKIAKVNSVGKYGSIKDDGLKELLRDTNSYFTK
jgi:hypothetical protein